MKVPMGALGRLVNRSGRRRGASALGIVGLLAGSLAGVVATAVVAAPSASAGTPPAAPSGWTTVFSDNFNGPAGSPPSAANWFYDEGNGGFGTGEVEDMTNSTANCSLDGQGDLKLTAIESGGSWTSCRLESTQDDFYAPPGGEMEMEASVEQPNPPSGEGLGYWPAFWALGSPGRAGGTWPTEGELDMMEDVNGLNESSQTLHDSGGGPGHALISCPTVGCQDGFNTYAVLINRVDTSAEYLEFIMDGTVEDTITEASVGTTAWQDAIDHGFFIMWDLAMGGNYPDGECNCTAPTSATASGYSMLANWVAVYETGTLGQNCSGYQGGGCVYPATPTASGEVTGYDGLCLENSGGNNTEGNPIEVGGCTAAAQQEWSVENNGSLQVQGGCLDVVAAGTASGTDVDWYACNGTAAQDWTYANDELVNPNSGLCLTVPSGDTADQLQIQTCTGASDQMWSLPTGGAGTTTTTAPATTTTTTAPATTTTAAPSGANCSASTSGQTQLNESAFTATTNTDSSGGDAAQNAITNAVSNSDSSRFSSDEPQADGFAYTVDMGSPQTFNEIQMQVPNSATDYARGYEVQVSSNGTSWTTVASCTGTGTPEIASFPAQTAQYLQVVLTAADPTYWWSIDQFDIYSSSAPATTTTTAPATTTTTAAPSGANCSASTSGQTQLNESAFAASTNAPSSSADAAQNAIANAVSHTDPDRFSSDEYQAAGLYFRVNMGSPQTVDEIEMSAPDYAGDYARGYEVQVSSNGTSWSTVASCTGSGNPEIVSFAPQTDQYLQVVLTTGSSTNWWSIEQFLMY